MSQVGSKGKMAEFKYGNGRSCGLYRTEPRPVFGLPAPLPFPSLPIPCLHCHFLSNRCLRCTARRDRAQLGPWCVHLPSSAASPRPDPAVGPGPSHSPAPCRSAARRPKLGCWQRDNLPCQQKKPECATDKLSGIKIYKNKKKRGGGSNNGPQRRDGMGKVEEAGKMPSLLAAFSSKWARNVRNIRRVQSENPRCCCEKKSSQSELGGCWEEPAAPTG